MKHLYSYDGPVMEFNRCIDNHWVGTTYAESEKKARNNLAYQFKKLTGRVARTVITLPGKIIEVKEERINENGY